MTHTTHAVDEVYVRLKITSENRSPDEVSRLVGLACDRAWCVGDLRPHTKIAERTNGWVIELSSTGRSSLQTRARELLQRVLPYAANIKSLAATSLIEFSCVVYTPQVPPLYLEKDIIDGVAQLGAALDIDLYILGSSGS
jgi:hypothetical protein